VNLDFLAPSSGAAIGRSPMQRSAADEGARFEVRDGFDVAVAYGADPEAERRTAASTAGWADVSHLRKLELQGPAQELAGVPLELGSASWARDAWWCPLTPTRTLVIGSAQVTATSATSVTDVTTTFAALTLVGPQATEVLARFSALDLRAEKTPVGALRPGSIARQPALLIHEAPQRYLFLFGWATAEYVWSVVADAGHHLGGRPIGADALALLAETEIAGAGRA
jgi:heterotetrameric sarcosine oxidase gamma subunit